MSREVAQTGVETGSGLISVGGRLALICIVAAAVLGLVNSVTEPRIAAVRARELEKALSTVAGGLEIGDFVPAEGGDIVNGHYPLYGGGSGAGGDGTGNGGEAQAYAVSLTGTGYGGEMEIIAAYGPGGRVRAAALLTNSETPGLGKEAEKPGYMDMFVGKGADEEIPTSKQELPQAQADAVSGATITFLGISEALSAGSEYVRTVGR